MLGITVQGESEMTPRQPLVSVPYPLNANDVRGADIHPDNVYAGTSVFMSSGYGVGVGSATGDGVSVSSHFAESTEHGIILMSPDGADTTPVSTPTRLSSDAVGSPCGARS